jgi:hypothetical protein
VGQALADSIFPPPGSPTVSTFPWGFALFSIAAFAIVIYLIRKF